MSKIPNVKMIGVFSIVGMLLFFGSVVYFLKDTIFRDDRDVQVMFFNESIKGLSVGSSVVFKGVEIGKVSKIDLIADIDTLSFLAAVFVNINSTKFIGISSGHTIKNKKEFIKELIGKGLRARLITQSILTGQIMIELEILPKTIALTRNEFYSDEYLEIPTIMSPFGELSKGLEDMEIRQTIANLNSFVTSLTTDVPPMLSEIKSFVEAFSVLVDENSPGAAITLRNMSRAAEDVGEAATSLRNFIEFLERNPEALIRGKKGDRNDK